MNKEETAKEQRKIGEWFVAETIQRDFDKWFDSAYEFKFGMKWSKGMLRKIAFKAYFAGYKLGESKESSTSGRAIYKTHKLVDEYEFNAQMTRNVIKGDS